jgi:hemolysin III
MLTSAVLFGVSALYHRGRWRPEVRAVLRRLDHANIYLLIAGSYTPVAVLALHGATQLVVLVSVWTAAAAGMAFRLIWINAPRWLYTPLYAVVGWVMVFVMPQLLHGAGAWPFSLIITGGVLYSLGGLVYGLKRPNPWPQVFGFHEVFHSLTLLAYAAQYAAISLIVFSGLRAAAI